MPPAWTCSCISRASTRHHRATRIDKLCRVLEMTPNELFGVGGKMDDDVSHLGTWGIKTALSLQDLLPAGRQAVTALLMALPKRQASPQTDRKQRRRKGIDTGTLQA